MQSDETVSVLDYYEYCKLDLCPYHFQDNPKLHDECLQWSRLPEEEYNKALAFVRENGYTQERYGSLRQVKFERTMQRYTPAWDIAAKLHWNFCCTIADIARSESRHDSYTTERVPVTDFTIGLYRDLEVNERDTLHKIRRPHRRMIPIP